MRHEKGRTVLRTLSRPGRKGALAAVALGGCLALTACGTMQLGAAAIVGNQRITTSTLSTQVSGLNRYFHAHTVQLAFPASQAPQQVLAWLIRFRVRDQMAVLQHINVTNSDVQRAITAITAQERQSGSSANLTAVAAANGLPPDLVNPDLGRYEAIQTALITKLGGTSSSSTADQQRIGNEFNRDQCLAAKSLHIRVSPQFGRLDYSQLALVAAADTLSAPEPGASPSPSPSTAPRFTPPC
jgi:peptidyl-prolyl cis-trans isomerase SurA